MVSPNSSDGLTIRPLQYRDLEVLEKLLGDETEGSGEVAWVRQWYGPLKLLSVIRNPWQNLANFWVAEHGRQLCGVVQIAPANRSRTTWKIVQVACRGSKEADALLLANDVGSQLLRHCLEHIWEARTWIAEVQVSEDTQLALYRKTGFQPLAELTRWAIAPEQLQALAERDPDLSDLLPISSADARLLHQLDTVSMPPILRQVYDRHVVDFQQGLMSRLVQAVQQWVQGQEVVRRYVFEPQRKAAIGSVRLTLSRHSDQPHWAELTVHPAYTWLYPELMTYMSQICLAAGPQPLQLVSADYQPEREEFLAKIQADRIDHALLMSRSVWHKLRESRGVVLEGLQLPDVLQGLQPSRQPVPGRISLTPPQAIRRSRVDSISRESQANGSFWYWGAWESPTRNHTAERNGSEDWHGHLPPTQA